MKRILFIIIVFLLYSFHTGIAQTYTSVTNVKTPNNSTVQDTYSLTSADVSYSSSQLAALASDLYNNYNGAELVDAPSYKYNCHAYAWHVSEGGSKVWIGAYTKTAEDIYWTDGSYAEVTESKATKVSYHQDGNHSAIRLNSTWYQSKWGASALVKHHPNDVPVVYQPSLTKKYYNRCSTTNYTNHTVTSNTTVSGCDINVQNVTVQNGAKLTLDAAGTTTITSGFEVQLGSELEIK
jgi:hypothetical protein